MSGGITGVGSAVFGSLLGMPIRPGFAGVSVGRYREGRGLMVESGPTQRRRNLWPEAECLHQYTSPETRIINGVGHVVRIVPERCYDCGYRYPIDASDLT